MTRNEKHAILDRSWDHALGMKRRAINFTAANGETCAYRGDDGERCIVGAFIDDDLAAMLGPRSLAGIWGFSADPTLAVLQPAVAQALGFREDDGDAWKFWIELQHAHDKVMNLEAMRVRLLALGATVGWVPRMGSAPWGGWCTPEPEAQPTQEPAQQPQQVEVPAAPPAPASVPEPELEPVEA